MQVLLVGWLTQPRIPPKYTIDILIANNGVVKTIALN